MENDLRDNVFLVFFFIIDDRGQIILKDVSDFMDRKQDIFGIKT